MHKKVGISIDRFQIKFGLITALEIAKEIGADAVDIMINHTGYELNDYRNPASIYSKEEDKIVSYFTAVKRKAEELGLEIAQTHGRMKGFGADPEENEAILENARLDCMVTAVLGAPVCVMHGASALRLGPDATLQQLRDASFDMFNRILPYASKYGIRIASETLGEAPEEFLISFNRVSAVDSDKAFSMCMDVGHSNKGLQGSGMTLGDVIRMYGSNISVLHLHDNNGLKDQHKMPMTGDIDWDDVLNALDEIGYKGVYNLEIKLEEFGWELIIPYAKFAIEVMKNKLSSRG